MISNCTGGPTSRSFGKVRRIDWEREREKKEGKGVKRGEGEEFQK
jgi:hypothetical protein